MYSTELLDHFEHPRNPGRLEAPDAEVTVENPACGDVLELSVQVESGTIAAIRFRAKGCVPAMACGSALTELVQGKSLAEARGLSPDALVQRVGGLPPASGHAAQLAIDALAEALRRIGK
jgi:nitrogen fixation NifU-like protein